MIFIMFSHPLFPSFPWGLTFLVEIEVLQTFVQIPGGGDSSDVGVGVDRSQAGDGGTVPYWREVPRL